MDLRPENIMLTDQNAEVLNFKLIDFGMIEKRPFLEHDSLKQVSEYRAPEVFVGHDYDEGVDMWCLGATCAEMLILNRAFGRGCKFDDPNLDRQVVSKIST